LGLVDESTNGGMSSSRLLVNIPACPDTIGAGRREPGTLNLCSYDIFINRPLKTNIAFNVSKNINRFRTNVPSTSPIVTAKRISLGFTAPCPARPME
jgi:hypothetical protein